MTWQTQSLSAQTLSALIHASSAINSTLDLQQVLQAIAQSVPQVLHSEGSSVLLLDRRRKKLIFRAAAGPTGSKLLDTEFDASLGIAGSVVKTGKPVIVQDAQHDDRFFKGIDARSSGTFTTRSLIAAPLVHRGQVLGVVEAVNKTGGELFTKDDLRVLRIFANLSAAAAVFNAQQHERLLRENEGLRQTLAGRDENIGASQALRETLQLGKRVARSLATVLLLGETGTGKELLARYIHENSRRADKPLIAVNCAALPETLLESELFGHEKGAFTGAVSQKAGRFELADGGTLFLDEIGDVPLTIQVKLLRVLQEKQFVRVGGTRTLACDVRILAATNRNLQAAIAAGRFRQDLFYRLNVFPIEMPPLRSRQEDIPLLVEHFARRSSVNLGVPQPRVSDEAMALLVMYPWPGNIRELQNVIERAVLLAEGEIQPQHLPPELASPAPTTPGRGTAPAPGTPSRGYLPPESAVPASTAPGRPTAPAPGAGLPSEGQPSLWGYEKALIVKALAENNWNQSKAARALGISRDNLRYRLKKFDIRKPDNG
jgi:Nif-specific regulatory protein